MPITMFGRRQLGQPQLRGLLSEGYPGLNGPRPGMFSFDPLVAFSGPQQNIASLERLGDRTFAGYQAGLDRDLAERQQRAELANRLGLANIDQATQFGVQDRRNTGQLSAIDLSGRWERTNQGDRLRSMEAIDAQRRALEALEIQGRFRQGDLDRASREGLTREGFGHERSLAELQRAAALEQIQARGGVEAGLAERLYGHQAGMQRSELTAQQALAEAAARERQRLQELVGRQQLEQLGTQGDFDLARQAGELGFRRQEGLETRALQRELGQLESAERAAALRASLGESAADRALRERLGQMQYGTPEDRRIESEARSRVAQAQAQAAEAQAQIAAAQRDVALDPVARQNQLQEGLIRLRQAEATLANLQAEGQQLPLRGDLLRAQARQAAAQAAQLEAEADPTGRINAILASPGARAIENISPETALPALLAGGMVRDPAVVDYLRPRVTAKRIGGIDASWIPFYQGTQADKSRLLEGLLRGRGLDRPLTRDEVDYLERALRGY